jgi:hypothetical protein
LYVISSLSGLAFTKGMAVDAIQNSLGVTVGATKDRQPAHAYISGAQLVRRCGGRKQLPAEQHRQ